MLIIPLSFPIAYAKLVGKGRGISILVAMLIGFGACLAIGLSVQSGPDIIRNQIWKFWQRIL